MVYKKPLTDPLILPGERYEIAYHFDIPANISHEDILDLKVVEVSVATSKFTINFHSIAKVENFDGYIFQGEICGDRVEGEVLKIVGNYNFYKTHGFFTTQNTH